MKTIMLIVHADAGQDARLQAALDLSRTFDGHLTCLDVRSLYAVPDSVYAPGGSAEAMASMRTAEDEHADAVRELVEASGVRWDWKMAYGPLAEATGDHAGLTDVIVSSRQSSGLLDVNLRRVTTTVALRITQPVIAVPESGAAVEWRGRALIAWNGSMPAMAALRAALPLLRIAEDVELLEVVDGRSNPLADAEAAAVYLSRQGVRCTVERITAPGKPVADLIEARGAAIDCAYLVLGAFGHNRVREYLFGGVTRSLIASSAVPLLMSH